MQDLQNGWTWEKLNAPGPNGGDLINSKNLYSKRKEGMLQQTPCITL